MNYKIITIFFILILSSDKIITRGLADLNIPDIEIKLDKAYYIPSLVLPKIFLPRVALDNKGNISPLFLFDIVKELDNKKNLNLLTAKSEYKVTQITKKVGNHTRQFFILDDMSMGKNYVIKESDLGLKELARLETVRKLLKVDYHKKHNVNYPNIVLPKAYFFYRFNNIKRYIQIMEKAKGIVLSKFIKKNLNKITANKVKRLKKAYWILGQTLSAFHRAYLSPDLNLRKAIIHGDFHFDNIIYDENNAKFYFIDNERIIKSIYNPMPVTEDFFKLFFYSYWTPYLFKEFLKGYVSIYKHKDKINILKQLKNLCLGEFIVLENKLSDNQMKIIKQNYIKPIFEKLLLTK